MNQGYSKKVLEYFLNPKNLGEVKNPDGVGRAGNPVCGDVMEVQIKVREGKISDIKFKTFGCAAAIASSNVLAEIVKNKPLENAREATYKEVLKELGDLPPLKHHCAVLAVQCLKKAIEDYEEKLQRNN
ncbi:MAG: iron-sulfur cluster assembly scaffold protein [Candidatus Helarchaeota archaeon]